MRGSRLFPIFVVVFIDLAGFGLILPLLPYYAETFGAGPTEIGLLVASYAAAQLVGAPILGRLSDRYGRRPLLLVSIFGNLVGFLMLGFAQSLWLLTASRVVAGLFGGNISVAQAYITDVTDERNRSQGLGLIGAAFGLGFILGPALGGTLSVGGFAAPSFAAAGMSALNLLMVALWLPESLTRERRAALAARPRTPFTLRALGEALGRPTVGPLLQTRFYFMLAFATFQSVFALYAQYRLGMTAQSTGYLLAYVGLLSVLVQGVAIGQLTARFQDRHLILSAVALMAASMLGWAYTPSLAWLMVVLAPMALAGGVLNTVVNSALTKAVQPEEFGGMLGLGASVESLTRVIAPTVGGVLLERWGTGAPGLFGALVLAGLTYYVWRKLLAPTQGKVSVPMGTAGLRAEPVAVEVEQPPTLR